MEIRGATPKEKMEWNRFVREHYPPVGGFMQSWRWGEFQESLQRRVERYFIRNGNEVIALFTFVHHVLPFGFSYGYLPRGPVIATGKTDEEISAIFHAIKKWARGAFPKLIFVRLEPPLTSLVLDERKKDFYFPSYYIQPRYNMTIPLMETEEEIVGRMHPSTRSNIRRAENRGVTVIMKTVLTEADYQQFFNMIIDTTARNKGKNIYPNESYLRSLVASAPPLEELHNPHRLSLGAFCGYQYGEPASMHLVLFFGDTATYLYGASYTKALSSKVTTYLHFTAMQEAKKRGLMYYDLGGIDKNRWATLTDFKRQFRGAEFAYIGNIDIVFRPVLYRVYNLLRMVKFA